MAQLEAQDLAQAVIDRMADCQEPRFKELMNQASEGRKLAKTYYSAKYDFKLVPSAA